MGRTGVPQDISGVIAALSSDHFSWVTGQTVHVNGGIFLC
jgi:3-oxoacyl-[acyl-carrier protein] reductase